METELGQPIMVYREKAMVRYNVVHRELTLYANLLLIRWHDRRGNRGEARTPLAEISPEINRSWQIHPQFRMGSLWLGFFGGGAILMAAIGRFGKSVHRPLPLFILAAACIVFAAWGIVNMRLYRQPLETAWFKNRQLQGIFSINRTKLESSRFDEFVSKVQEQVRKSGLSP